MGQRVNFTGFNPRRIDISAPSIEPADSSCYHSVMEHYKVILPAHLNHYGYLFGGHMLQWIDEFAYITANQEFPGNNFVTVAFVAVDAEGNKQSVKKDG
jgi:acyl-CoA hydrolase